MTDVRTRATEYLDLEDQITAARAAYQAASEAREAAVVAEDAARDNLQALIAQRGTAASALRTAAEAETGRTRG